jgi:nitrite reductase/ring-hydroxylating ferredoxin subunit
MSKIELDPLLDWFLVAEKGSPAEGSRMHVRVRERYITIFRHRGILSAIDSICHHAGGPLTLGEVKDIEDLNITVVLCPWHHFMVSIDGGRKAYQSVEVINDKPVITGWKIGKVVQRPHVIRELDSGIYISPQLGGEECVSDKDASNHLCGKNYPIFSEASEAVNHK